jgi:hypothetical protein
MAVNKIFGSSSIDDLADNVLGEVDDFMLSVEKMQQRKLAGNVQLVIQALKKIESDLQDKYDGVTTVIEKRVSTIKDGRDGIDGRNGRDGKDGRPGRDGAPGTRGFDGAPGQDGMDGMDGVSVTDARIDFDGSLVISLSSGREINVGEVVAPDLAERIKVITNGGGTSQGVLDTLASLQAQITAISSLGAVNYVGTWNASTNTPTIVSGAGDKGEYYVVSVAGNITIDGQAQWGVGDWIIFNGTAWQKVDGGNTGDFTNVTVGGDLTLTGGLANGVTYLDASKILSANSNLTYNGATFQIGNGGGSAQLILSGSGYGLTLGTAGGTVFGFAEGAASLVINGASVPLGIGTTASQPIVFGTNNTEQARLTNSGLEIKQSQLIGYSSYTGIGTNGLAVAGNVGVGTASPNSKLTVGDPTGAVLGIPTTANFYGTNSIASSIGTVGLFSTETAGADVGPVLTFGGKSGNTFSPYPFAFIQGAKESATAGSYAGYLRFVTIPASGGAPVEGMRLSSVGNLGIGTAPTGQSKFQVYTGNNAINGIQTQFNGSNPPIALASTTSNGFPYVGFNTVQVVSSDNQTYAVDGFASRLSAHSGGNGGFQFNVAASGTAGNAITFTQAMTLDASGNLFLGRTSQINDGQLSIETLGSNSSVITTNWKDTQFLSKMYFSSDYYLGVRADAANRELALIANSGDATAKVAFYTGGAGTPTERGRFSSDGTFRVKGAGTAGSTDAFQVAGTAPADAARIDSSGNLIQTVNTTAATLATNGTLTFSIVDNSTLRISVRGSDGTTRTATVALT